MVTSYLTRLFFCLIRVPWVVLDYFRRVTTTPPLRRCVDFHPDDSFVGRREARYSVILLVELREARSD